MKRQEALVAVVVLALIGLGAAAIQFGKPHMGKPGLALEKATLTNELGKVIRTERVKLPERVAEFRSVEAPIMDNEATNLPPDTVFGRRKYGDSGGFVAQMSAVMMQTDRTSIHRPQTCITGQGWKILKTEVIDIPVASPRPYVLKATCLTSTREAKLKTGESRPISSLYIYWFVSEKRLAAGHPEALWAISEDLLTTGTLYPWAYVSCFSYCEPGQEGVYLARMKRLISTSVPEFQLMPPPNVKQTASLPDAASVK
jgi:hypothetical protein